MPGKFSRPYQHSSLWIPGKLKNQILTSKPSHQQVPSFFPSWKSGAEKIIILKEKNPNPITVEIRCRKNLKLIGPPSKYQTQYFPSNASWLPSWIDMPQAADGDSNKPSPPCLHGQQLITSQTRSDSHCSRGNLEGNIKEPLHLGEHSYMSTRNFLLPLPCSHREASLILQSRNFQRKRKKVFNTKRQTSIYSIMPRSRISDITVPLSAFSCALGSCRVRIPCLAARQLCWPCAPEQMSSHGWIFPEHWVLACFCSHWGHQHHCPPSEESWTKW